MTDLRVDVRFDPADADALRRAEQRLGLAISAARLGAWEYDIETRALTANAQCKANHGFGPDDDMQLEMHIIPAIEPSHRQRFRDTIEQAIVSGGAFEIELPHRFPDGSRHWVLIAGQVVTPGSMLGVSKDITLRKQGEQALRESEERLREADRMKDEFLAVVAHELRGPLAPILTAVRLLEIKGPADAQLQKLRETIQRQATQLSKLVDDLLDMGRITAGKLRLTTAVVDLRSIVTQAIEGCLPQVEKRGHRLHVDLPDQPVVLDVDAARLVQVVSNLLSNAAKYQKDGGRIDVALRVEGRFVTIHVRDEGVGFAPEMRDRIFHRFVQVDASRHRDEGGLGIGLSLVKAVLELHGGSVEAHSGGIGRGSEFIVRLPA